ncbi:O-antigen translocase [Synoicihabitans lomoniglobus]|uniref:O-antigen translocase n=1 Tax=Synoicihabitans lomoniglobus TaxID=2909285 RepID=A0AAF0I3T1_9BACT|nr:O-antigen translocase [Opitutaceae bacterium LMO-M01]WED66344.1 O-antigen translocase [Opitutaceae bacterium LMO-M01]
MNQSSSQLENGYGQIIRSSFIIGGATGINYIIGLMRTKAVAVLLGPSGVGLVGLYVSLAGLISTVAQLGINQSGVREVAEAHGTGDPQRVAKVTKTLRRICWITGVLGWILTAALAWPLSLWTFGSSERLWPIAILGSTVLISAVIGGQTALIQGMRRIGDLARIQVLSAVLTTMVAIGLYAWLSEEGIVPVIILTAVIQLGFSWYYSRKIQITEIPQSWAETASASKRLISLGAALMYGAVLAGIVGLALRSIIVRNLGLEANGLFQAAWMISGMFAGFILSAMGTDFYPRLTAVAHDNEQVNKLVNEQIEIGILLAVPGLLGALAFAPWLMHLLYSAKFLQGADLLPWFLIGVFGQVISWPLGMVQQAKAATGWLYFSRTHGAVVQFVSAAGLMYVLGLVGVAIGFVIYIWLQLILTLFIAHRLSGFRFKTEVLHFLSLCLGMIVFGGLCSALLPSPWSILVSGSVCGLGVVWTVRKLRKRMPLALYFNRFVCKVFSGLRKQA